MKSTPPVPLGLKPGKYGSSFKPTGAQSLATSAVAQPHNYVIARDPSRLAPHKIGLEEAVPGHTSSS